jgi:hypothetical protein
VSCTKLEQAGRLHCYVSARLGKVREVSDSIGMALGNLYLWLGGAGHRRCPHMELAMAMIEWVLMSC